ncbi:hypothetical protein NE237_026607 [Protea cynaroides]|uniref:Uncharacterized protein n=1 Tax=Protea cynaroides TaxID=273540 RepID=A0A9Q0H427_9MAGN|nr:hypothetical protein NE237_026607 [Protea cynaroides]
MPLSYPLPHIPTHSKSNVLLLPTENQLAEKEPKNPLHGNNNSVTQIHHTFPYKPNFNSINPYGFLKFPSGYNVEIASLGSKIKDRYPSVQIDVVTSPTGKQTHEMNKNVRWADAYDPDGDFPEPAEYTDMIGVLNK